LVAANETESFLKGEGEKRIQDRQDNFVAREEKEGKKHPDTVRPKGEQGALTNNGGGKWESTRPKRKRQKKKTKNRPHRKKRKKNIVPTEFKKVSEGPPSGGSAFFLKGGRKRGGKTPQSHIIKIEKGGEIPSWS